MKNSIFYILALASCFFGTFAFADYIEPGSIQLATQKFPAVSSAVRAGTHVFDIAWQGIPVGQASVVTSFDEKDPSKVLVEASAKSGKVIDLFYKLRHTSNSEFLKQTFRPLKFSSHQVENERTKKVEVSFFDDGRIESRFEKNGKIDSPKEFISKNETLDPITAAFFARSIDIKEGVRASFDVFNGKHRYLISFFVESLETIHVLGVDRKAYKVVPKITKLTDSEGEKRFRQGHIWIAADESRDILRLESEVFVGSISAKLSSVKYDPSDTPLVEIARKP